VSLSKTSVLDFVFDLLSKANVLDLLTGSVLLALAVGVAELPAWAQYPGQLSKDNKAAPELRAVAVLEWTGEPGKPKTSRLVPITIFDGQALQDGSIYLARPEPLGLAGEVEYQLKQDGKTVGLFEIKNAGQEQGSWVGYGTWKPLPVARPKPAAIDFNDAKVDVEDDDHPTLHRKHHADDPPANGKGSGDSSSDSAGSGSSGSAHAPDSDRPVLHKKDDSSTTASDSGASSSGNSNGPMLHKKDSSDSSNDSSSSSGNSSTPSDPNRPVLHKKDDSSTTASDSGTSSASNSNGPVLHKHTDDDTASSSPSSDDPDRPVLKKAQKNSKKQPEDVAHVDSLPEVSDPDRPRLQRGKTDNNLAVIPSLMGLPPDMQQAVAVSDAKNTPDHPWNFSWANPDDEEKMKSSLEDLARAALGLNPPAPRPVSKAGARKTAVSKKAKLAPPPPPPAALVDEEFRVFQLAYGSGATAVLAAHTAGPLAQEKFVTLVAQPDLYGNVQVLLKSVTDGAHLDETPRMRLVDAVDAMADNRGELLFELRGATERQFALYRILRGKAEKLFVSGGTEFVAEGGQ
jgi:hypothetical protein